MVCCDADKNTEKKYYIYILILKQKRVTNLLYHVITLLDIGLSYAIFTSQSLSSMCNPPQKYRSL